MAITITNDAQLEAFMTQQLADVLDEVIWLLLEKLKDNIQKHVYARKRKPAKYERRKWNGGLLEEWGKSSIRVRHREAEVAIEESPELMHNIPEKFVHGSNYYYTSDITELLSELIIKGTSGDFFGEGYWTEERDFWEPTMKLLKDGWIEKQIEKAFRKRKIKYERIRKF